MLPFPVTQRRHPIDAPAQVWHSRASSHTGVSAGLHGQDRQAAQSLKGGATDQRGVAEEGLHRYLTAYNYSVLVICHCPLPMKCHSFNCDGGFWFPRIGIACVGRARLLCLGGIWIWICQALSTFVFNSLLDSASTFFPQRGSVAVHAIRWISAHWTFSARRKHQPQGATRSCVRHSLAWLAPCSICT